MYKLRLGQKIYHLPKQVFDGKYAMVFIRKDNCLVELTWSDANPPIPTGQIHETGTGVVLCQKSDETPGEWQVGIEYFGSHVGTIAKNATTHLLLEDGTLLKIKKWKNNQPSEVEEKGKISFYPV
jgi:hypothetical protein